MLIKKSGIFKTIDSKDFGIFQLKGWEKVINEPLPKLEEVAEVVEPVVEDEPIAEVVDEMPKSKKNRKK